MPEKQTEKELDVRTTAKKNHKITLEAKDIQECHAPRHVWLPTLCISICISILTTALSFYAYDTYFATKIRTVDFKGYVARQRKLFLAGVIDEDALKNNLKIFQERIHAAPENITILVKEAVVSDAETLKN